MAKEKTVKDVFNELTEERKNVVYFMIGKTLGEYENEKIQEKTVKDFFDELTEEQKNVVYFMIGQALKDALRAS